MPTVHKLADVQTAEIGQGSRIWQFAVVLNGARIGKDCNICAHTFIEGGVTVGDNVTVNVPGTVDADGNLFSEADKKQMIACCSNELRLDTDPELQRLAEEQGDVAEKLRQMIVLSKDFVPPTEPLDKMAGNDINVAWG